MRRSQKASIVLGTLFLLGLLGLYSMMIPSFKENPWISVISAVRYHGNDGSFHTGV